MKISVLGAGPIGVAIACDLVERPEVSHVQVVDQRAASLAALEGAGQEREAAHGAGGRARRAADGGGAEG